LKQFLVNLVCSADGGIPVWLKVGSGNETDSQTFAGLMRSFAEQWETPALMVADAAFYSEPNLQQVGRLPWLSRVPQTLKAAQTLVDSPPAPFTERPCDLEGYRLWNGRPTLGWNSAGFWWKACTGDAIRRLAQAPRKAGKGATTGSEAAL
jgi:hypothetical protein